MKREYILIVFLVAFVNFCSADLKLASMFSDGMVFQRDKPVQVWGWDDAGAIVSVEFAGQKKTAVCYVGGKWMVTLDPMRASFFKVVNPLWYQNEWFKQYMEKTKNKQFKKLKIINRFNSTNVLGSQKVNHKEEREDDEN